MHQYPIHQEAVAVILILQHPTAAMVQWRLNVLFCDYKGKPKYYLHPKKRHKIYMEQSKFLQKDKDNFLSATC